MTGRPEIYSEELAAKVLERISDGQSLRTVCKPEGMPNMTTVWKWLYRHEAFVEQYARATSERAEAMAEDIQAIADDESIDPKSRTIRIDARKWLASKLKPKKFGERVALGADDDGRPIVISWIGEKG